MNIPIEFAGRRFLLDDQNGTDLVARQMQSGGYEAPLPMLTLAVMSRTGGLFCDVGANNGLYTILACHSIPTVTVAAFEPYPPVLQALRSNIAINNLTHRVQIHEIALSDADGTASLYVPDPRHGLLETSCSLESSFKTEEGKGSIQINKRRFDDYEQDLANISLIKVDIEGHELSFLRGAVNALKRHRPIVFAEMLPLMSRNFYEITELLDNLGYIKFRLRDTMAIKTSVVMVDHLAWNYAMIPKEKLVIFEHCCKSHNLEMFSDYR